MKKTGAWFMGLNRRAVLLSLFVAVVAAAATLFNFSPWTSPPAHAQEALQISGPFYSQAMKFDISPPLRSMTPLVQTTCTKADCSNLLLSVITIT